MDLKIRPISLLQIYIPNPLNQLEKWERLKYMSFVINQLHAMMPIRINASCENGITLQESHVRTNSIPFPPNLEYPRSHPTPSSRVVEG